MHLISTTFQHGQSSNTDGFANTGPHNNALNTSSPLLSPSDIVTASINTHHHSCANGSLVSLKRLARLTFSLQFSFEHPGLISARKGHVFGKYGRWPTAAASGWLVRHSELRLTMRSGLTRQVKTLQSKLNLSNLPCLQHPFQPLEEPFIQALDQTRDRPRRLLQHRHRKAW